LLARRTKRTEAIKRTTNIEIASQKEKAKNKNVAITAPTINKKKLSPMKVKNFEIFFII
jgi:hypothetical protein